MQGAGDITVSEKKIVETDIVVMIVMLLCRVRIRVVYSGYEPKPEPEQKLDLRIIRATIKTHHVIQG